MTTLLLSGGLKVCYESTGSSRVNNLLALRVLWVSASIPTVLSHNTSYWVACCLIITDPSAVMLSINFAHFMWTLADWISQEGTVGEAPPIIPFHEPTSCGGNLGKSSLILPLFIHSALMGASFTQSWSDGGLFLQQQQQFCIGKSMKKKKQEQLMTNLTINKITVCGTCP